MQLPKDLLSDTYRAPNVVLCQTNKEKICKLNVTNLEGTFKFNSYSEISFDVPSIYCDIITGETKPTPYYDYVEGLRLVYLEGFGYFQLQDPEIDGNGIQEYKHINAYSLEYSLSQRYLENFTINASDVEGAVSSIDEVVLYNPKNIAHSLIHLVLQKAYGWTVGHVDDELKNQGRSFEIDRQSIYDFIMNDMCETFKCYAEFDTINNRVNIYAENEAERFIGDGKTNSFKLQGGVSADTEITINGHVVTEYKYNQDTKELSFNNIPAQGDIIEVSNEFKHKYDTDVIVSFENLSNDMKVNYSADDIKTVLAVKGADDLDIRNVNFGLSSIMNLDYYCTPEWMGDNLYKEYKYYMDKQSKYMSGFYNKDISGSAEEYFDVKTTKEDFVAGGVQQLPVQSAQEQFNVNGDTVSYNIDKVIKEYKINSETEEIVVDSKNETFNEPNMQVETITAQEDVATFTFDGSYIFTLPSDFNFNENSIVKIEGKEVNNTNYKYSNNNLEIINKSLLTTGNTVEVITCENKFVIESVITKDSKIIINGARELTSSEYSYVTSGNKKYLIVNIALAVGDEIEINTPSGTLFTIVQVSIPNEYAIAAVKVDGNDVKYTVNTTGSTITINDTDAIKYGSIIEVEYIQNRFTLEKLRDKVVSVEINGTDSSKYELDGAQLTINGLSVGDTIKVESIDTQFDLSDDYDKEIVSVMVNGEKQQGYNLDGNILTINELNPSDRVVINLVNNKFESQQYDKQILSVKINSQKVNYTFSDNVVTVSNLDLLFSGEQIVIEFVPKSFSLSLPKDKIVSVLVDGKEIGVKQYEYDYSTKKLTISLDNLLINSSVVVASIDTHFDVKQLSANENIAAVCILRQSNDGKTQELTVDVKDYTYDKNENSLVVNDSRLSQDDIVLFKTINKSFVVSNSNKALTSVRINDNITEDYTFNSSILTITTSLGIGDTVSAEFLDNHFVLQNDIGSKHIVEKKSPDSMLTETISEGENGYLYNKTTKTLTVYAPLENGDKLIVKTIEVENALLVVEVVESDAGDGQILITDVYPKLDSYEPKAGDYVVWVEGYTETLKRLYELIDSQLTEENSVPDEYKITEKIVTPENFEQAGLYLPEASIDNLGEVYKIVNQDNNGNEVASKYYVCEIKVSIVKNEQTGKDEQKYTYVWNERNLVVGAEGINSLKEKKDIYLSIQDVQIAAEWDKKDADSDEYKAYINNLNKLNAINKELENKQKKVEDIQAEIQKVNDEITLISEDISVNKNFTPENLDRLSLFLREDEYSDDCFYVSEIDTDLDKINTQKELLVAGQKELKKISQPKLSFSASMRNIYAMPEFAPILNQFSLGNFVKVKLRDNFIKKARLLEVQLNFSDLSNFSCTFGDLLSAKDQGDIHADLLSQAVSAGKAVASGSSYWQKGYDVATAIDERIRNGLIDATTSIKSNSAGQSVSWDNYGIHLRKVVDGVLDNHEGWITNNKFLYSDDNFQTTKSVFGNYTINGEEYWGILAGCVRAGLVEGSSIVGGQICIGEQEDGSYAFMVDKDGTVTMNKGDAAEKLSFFSFDGDNGLVVGENNGSGEYFSRVSAQRIEFCRKARIITVESEPTQSNRYNNYDYILYIHQENNDTYYDYYKNPDFLSAQYKPISSIGENFADPEIKFGIPITYFANDTAYMKQAEIEGSLKVGTEEKLSSISLGNFKLQIESNGSLSIVAIQ
nr:MAG TPA: tail protein [Caudoviricetes sp.]